MQNNIQNNLISWYNHNHRQFPWRETTNPYYIWISEIMLQQTTTEAVIPYYKRFIQTFDTIDKLAEEFFILSTGLAGEILQKFINYGKVLVIIDELNIFMKLHN